MAKTASMPNELYFITMTIVDWLDIFNRQIYFEFIVDNLNYCQEKKGLEIFEYVIMTNHIHMICLANDKPLSDILRDFKTFTSKGLVNIIKDNPDESRKEWMLKIFKEHGQKNPLNKYSQVWQNFNYPTYLDNNLLIDQKTEYIHMNPVVAGFVSEPHEYYYSSAHQDSPVKIFDF